MDTNFFRALRAFAVKEGFYLTPAVLKSQATKPDQKEPSRLGDLREISLCSLLWLLFLNHETRTALCTKFPGLRLVVVKVGRLFVSRKLKDDRS